MSTVGLLENARSRREATTCAQGHSLTDAYVRACGDGYTRRYCRSCAKAASRDQKAFVRGWRVGTFESVFGQPHEAAA